MEAKYQIKDCQPQDGGMRCTVSVGDGCIAASGRADGLTGQLAFTYQPDGKVRKAVLTIDDPRVQDYARFSGASDAWVLVNRPEEWGKIDYGSRAGGAAMVKLCQEYAESLKAPPTPADPVAPVKAWVDAMNNGDVDAALALFTDDAKLLMGALLFASGKNEVRAMLDADVGRETQYLIKDCQPAEDRVECAISFVDACTAASGVKDGLPMKMVFTLRDGKIGQSVMASEGGEQAIYDLWEHKMEIWAKANRAEEWAQYVAKGETREGESIYAKLCQEYAESLK
jgi:ketosteroid isomerase-like protein